MSKKLYSTDKWKRFLRSRQEYELKRLLHRRRNGTRSGRPNAGARRPTTKLVAPSIFSVVHNPEETIAFLKLVRHHGVTHNLAFDLSEVKTITIDAITALIATINRICTIDGASVRGNEPLNAIARDILAQSGFYAYLKSKNPPANLGKISQQRSKKVEPNIARDLIHAGTKVLVGSEQRCPAAYRVLIESMNNTHNHAAERFHSPETWWSTVYADTPRNRICYVFLDTGVGIFKSVKIRGFRTLYRKWGKGRAHLLQDILQGKVESSTGRSYRGKGLPAIHKLSLNQRIHNLTIISNDVYGNVASGEYKTLKSPFRGTLLYWET